MLRGISNSKRHATAAGIIISRIGSNRFSSGSASGLKRKKLKNSIAMPVKTRCSAAKTAAMATMKYWAARNECMLKFQKINGHSVTEISGMKRIHYDLRFHW